MNIVALIEAQLTWLPAPAVVTLIIVLKILCIVVPVMGSVAYLTLAERKVIGFIQVRIGPNRVGPLGLLQPIADALKLLCKEVIVPSGSNRFLFLVAPVLALGPALAAWAVIPFDAELILADISAGLLYILALTSLGVYGIIVAGWASNSKYAFLGAMRSAAQIVSYEIPMGFALVGVLVAAGSLNLGQIVEAQRGGLGLFSWFWLPLFPIPGIPDGIHWFIAKTAFFLFLFLWFRATFPRYRYDQIMRLGWKIFLPITIVWIIVVSAMVVWNVPPWFAA